MIRVLLGAGSAAAANGITADVDLLLDAGAAGSSGDDFTINLTLDEGAATGEGFSAGLDESAALSIAGGAVAAGVEIAGADETVTVTFNDGQAPANGLNTNISVLWVPGEAEGDGGVVLPAIGDAFEGGFYAGLISHTADGVATHALIVAPRATGASGTGYTITTLPSWQTSDSTTGATSPFDGAVNTPLITNSPAANFCKNLSIGGYSDWYLPARFELDIAYKNLKPSTDSNNTSFGINDYSVPKRTVNHTAGDPAQTSLAAFQTGGAEAFSAVIHWSSTEQFSSTAWSVSFFGGAQSAVNKAFGRSVRAFRKIAL
jgi:hypothetical protein